MRELEEAYKTARRKMGLPVAIAGEEQLEHEIEESALGAFWLKLLPNLSGDTTLDQICEELERPVY